MQEFFYTRKSPSVYSLRVGKGPDSNLLRARVAAWHRHYQRRCEIELGWDQKTYAERIGLTPATVSGLLKARAGEAPRAAGLKALASLLWLPFSDVDLKVVLQTDPAAASPASATRERLGGGG